MTRILIASDKFKTTLSSAQVAEALSQGLKRSLPEAAIQCLTVSDGGEGFIDALSQAEELRLHPLSIAGPSGKRTISFLGISEKHDRIYIESCQATGFHLLPPAERNPLRTSSKGLAQLLKAAFDLSPLEIFVGLGSSATCDAGIPVAQAFGYRFLGKNGVLLKDLQDILREVETIEPPDPAYGPRDLKLYAVSDVKNPPIGPDGGVLIYSPQKGASKDEIEFLEKGMTRLLEALKRLKGKDFSQMDGGGAGGCLALGLHVFLDAEIVDGSTLLFEKLNLEEKISGADAVITGEGHFDRQSYYGKIPGRIVETALKKKKPVFLVTGKKTADIPQDPKLRTLSIEEHLQTPGLPTNEKSFQTLIYLGAEIGEILKK